MDHVFDAKSGRFNKALQNIINDPQELFILDVSLLTAGEWPNPNEENLSLLKTNLTELKTHLEG